MTQYPLKNTVDEESQSCKVSKAHCTVPAQTGQKVIGRAVTGGHTDFAPEREEPSGPSPAQAGRIKAPLGLQEGRPLWLPLPSLKSSWPRRALVLSKLCPKGHLTRVWCKCHLFPHKGGFFSVEV